MPPAWWQAQQARCRLLHLSARHDAWQRWFVTAGVDNPQAMAGACDELFSMLVPCTLLQAEISSGNLLMPCELPWPSDNAYDLVYPPDQVASLLHQALAGCLLQQAASYRESLIR